MRETNQIVRQWCGQRKCWALAGVGCLWAGGKPLEMHVDQAGEGMITVKIRVGPLGDREAEDVIYAGISDTLRAKR